MRVYLPFSNHLNPGSLLESKLVRIGICRKPFMIEETHLEEFPGCTRGNSSGFIFSFNYSFTLPMTYSINIFQYGNINNLISSINKIYSSAFISLTCYN